MDKDKSSAEIANVFPKAPEMFVIKGRQTDYVSLPAQSLYAELKKFARIKHNTTLLLQLPLDSLFMRALKRTADIILSTIVITTILSWLIPIMALLIKLDSKGPV